MDSIAAIISIQWSKNREWEILVGLYNFYITLIIEVNFKYCTKMYLTYTHRYSYLIIHQYRTTYAWDSLVTLSFFYNWIPYLQQAWSRVRALRFTLTSGMPQWQNPCTCTVEFVELQFCTNYFASEFF